jgi:hypothetical protein
MTGTTSLAAPAVFLDWFVEPTDTEPSEPRVIEAVFPLGWQTLWAEALRQLLRAGYVRGPPAQLSADARLELLGGYRNMECDSCGNTGPHSVHLFHRGASGRGVVSCSVCNRCCEV